MILLDLEQFPLYRIATFFNIKIQCQSLWEHSLALEQGKVNKSNSVWLTFKAAEKGYQKALSEAKKVSWGRDTRGIKKIPDMSRHHHILAKRPDNGLTCVRLASSQFTARRRQ